MDAQARIAEEKEESERRTQRAEAIAKAKVQLAIQEAKARLRAAKLVAISGIHVTLKGFSDCKFNLCTFMRVEIINGSKEALSGILVGLSTIPSSKDACPPSYATRKNLNIDLSPGERRVATIDFVDIGFSKHPVCIKVLDVKFASK